MPMPLSITEISKYSPICVFSPVVSEMLISPFLGVYLKALEKMFIKTLSKLFRSIQTISDSNLCSKLKSIFFLLASYSNVSIKSSIKPTMLVSLHFNFICPLSSLRISINWFISLSMRCALR